MNNISNFEIAIIGAVLTAIAIFIFVQLSDRIALRHRVQIRHS